MLVPKTKLGSLSFILLLVSIFCFSIFQLFIIFGERGGQEFFSNLKLAFSGLSVAVSAIASFFTGIISIIKNKERSFLTFLSTFIGLMVLLFVTAEILFPH